MTGFLLSMTAVIVCIALLFIPMVLFTGVFVTTLLAHLAQLLPEKYNQEIEKL